MSSLAVFTNRLSHSNWFRKLFQMTLWLITGATYTSYSPTAYTLGNLTKSFPVTEDTQAEARVTRALGRHTFYSAFAQPLRSLCTICACSLCTTS